MTTKAVKSLHATVSIRLDGQYAKAHLTLATSNNDTIEINAQADRGQDARGRNCKRHTSIAALKDACGAFYAVQAQCSVGFCGWGDQPELDRITGLRKLIDRAIVDGNLYHVYPDCEFSRLLGALERLGVKCISGTGDVTINGEDLGDWRRNVNASIKAA